LKELLAERKLQIGSLASNFIEAPEERIVNLGKHCSALARMSKESYNSFAPFLYQRKIALLLIPFAGNFREIFPTLIGVLLIFLKDKRSNKIENIQYF
jgi:hypothetical protein